MLRAILNKSWRQHTAKHQLYGHLPPITKTIQVRHTRHAGHCWRSRDDLIGDVLLWTPAYGRAKAGRPARTYIQQLCEDTGCRPEDLSEAINDREKWRERIRDIRAASTTWWWWWWCILFRNWPSGTSCSWWRGWINSYNKNISCPPPRQTPPQTMWWNWCRNYDQKEEEEARSEMPIIKKKKYIPMQHRIRNKRTKHWHRERVSERESARERERERGEERHWK